MEDKAVAYIDILGFKYYVNKNNTEALPLLYGSNYLLNEKFKDGCYHPVSSYEEELKELAQKSLIGSFEHFLPFSDCIFIVSSDPNIFVKQLSRFVIDCFLLTANSYANPEKASKPTLIEVTEIKAKNEGGEVETSKKKEYWHPLLFRGGISYGDVQTVKLNSISSGKLEPITNLSGSAVVRAVADLEPFGNGPRLFIDNRLYDKLNEQTRYYCRKLDESHYEILWPAYHFIEENPFEMEIQRVDDLLTPAINLWKGFLCYDFGFHYCEFVKLIIFSTIKYAEKNRREQAEEIITCILNSTGMGEQKENLFC